MQNLNIGGKLMLPVKVKKLRETALLPTYATAEAAGADLYACLDAPVEIQPGPPK